ncbi:MAG TPA: hypothetical protein VKN18_32980 [Blastocatellia bacterium]|nr:hypothetical protein [Blastocatellia bacterium]
MNKQDDDNPAVIADLPVDEAKQDEVNGGEVQGDLGKTYYIGSANGGVWK